MGDSIGFRDYGLGSKSLRGVFKEDTRSLDST